MCFQKQRLCVIHPTEKMTCRGWHPCQEIDLVWFLIYSTLTCTIESLLYCSSHDYCMSENTLHIWTLKHTNTIYLITEQNVHHLRMVLNGCCDTRQICWTYLPRWCGPVPATFFSRCPFVLLLRPTACSSFNGTSRKFCIQPKHHQNVWAL